MKHIDGIKLSPTSTVREALQIIDSGAMKIALVVGDGNKLLGTLSDGDIRRGLLNGLTLDDSIESVIFRKPLVAHVNDSKETILQKAVAKKIYQIPIVDHDGTLIGIEEVDELLRPKELPNKVVLMAGGLGTRLRPLTDDRPKPLLEVGSKPILETIIENFAKYGFKNFILSVNYKAHMLEDYFGAGGKLGVHIDYIHENKRLGTAGALSLMHEKLQEPFFVMNGDLLTNVNFEQLFDYHHAHHAVATMAVREYDFQVPYGVVNVEDGHIRSIEEKPIQRFFVSAGIYMLSPEVLSYIPRDSFYDMPTLFTELITNKMTALSFPIREYWLDIGRMEELERAKSDYAYVFNAY
jgi:dTDP-glucose pyrophosphorylase